MIIVWYCGYQVYIFIDQVLIIDIYTTTIVAVTFEVGAIYKANNVYKIILSFITVYIYI